jgi:hypothetical protein
MKDIDCAICPEGSSAKLCNQRLHNLMAKHNISVRLNTLKIFGTKSRKSSATICQTASGKSEGLKFGGRHLPFCVPWLHWTMIWRPSLLYGDGFLLRFVLASWP